MFEQKRVPSKRPFDGQFRTADNVVARQQAGATILLDLRRGRYYTLNPVSGLIWSVLDGGASMERVIARVREEFDVPDEQIANDVEEFVGSLLSVQLIRRDA